MLVEFWFAMADRFQYIWGTQVCQYDIAYNSSANFRFDTV